MNASAVHCYRHGGRRHSTVHGSKLNNELARRPLTQPHKSENILDLLTLLSDFASLQNDKSERALIPFFFNL